MLRFSFALGGFAVIVSFLAVNGITEAFAHAVMVRALLLLFFHFLLHPRHVPTPFFGQTPKELGAANLALLAGTPMNDASFECFSFELTITLP